MDLTVRPATVNDARILFMWRNDDLTRSMSINSAPVEWMDHLRWLKARLVLPVQSLFIVEKDGVPVGTYRIDGGTEISYTVAPEVRGRGVASAMLKMARERHGPLRAVIFEDNTASVAAAKKAGFDVVIMRRGDG